MTSSAVRPEHQIYPVIIIILGLCDPRHFLNVPQIEYFFTTSLGALYTIRFSLKINTNKLYIINYDTSHSHLNLIFFKLLMLHSFINYLKMFHNWLVSFLQSLIHICICIYRISLAMAAGSRMRPEPQPFFFFLIVQRPCKSS